MWKTGGKKTKGPVSLSADPYKRGPPRLPVVHRFHITVNTIERVAAETSLEGAARAGSKSLFAEDPDANVQAYLRISFSGAQLPMCQ